VTPTLVGVPSGPGRRNPGDTQNRNPAEARSASVCEPYVEAIEAGLSKGRNAQGDLQDLVDVYGFTGGYQERQTIHPQSSWEQSPKPVR